MPMKLICFGEQKLTRHRIYLYGPNKKKVGGNINNHNMKPSVVTSNGAVTEQDKNTQWGAGAGVCVWVGGCACTRACVVWCMPA